MKMKKLYWLPLVVMLAAAILFAGCDDAVVPTDPSETEEVELTLDSRSALMNSGDTLHLGVTGAGEDLQFASSDPEVACVDANGNVQALKKGNAMITATSGGRTAYCGIMVDAQGEMLELSDTQAVEIVPPVQLYHQHTIISFAADPENGAFYFSQQYAEKLLSDSMITKVTQVDGVWQRTEYVHLYNHGYGYFTIEKDGDDTYLLSESNGVLTNQGTTISRVLWENEKFYDEEFGDTYELGGLEGSPRPQSSVDDDVVVVYDFNGRDSSYAIYDRDALYSGQENNYLYRVRCASRQTPVAGEDDSDGKYNSAIRGFVYKDGYIYQLSGSGKIYISVFDLQGNLQYCHEVEEYPDLPRRQPGSIAISGDDIYIAVNSAENTTVNLASVWKLEEVAQ